MSLNILMKNVISVTAAVSFGAVVAASAAAAESVPANVNECLEKSFAAIGKAKAKGLSEAALKDIEPLVEKLEGQCDSGALEAAAKTLSELESKIAGS